MLSNCNGKRRIVVVWAGICCALSSVLVQANDDVSPTMPTKTGSFLRTSEPGFTCGVYSLHGALTSLGYEVEVSELLSNEYVTGIKGSSVAQLIRAARRCGAYAYGYHGLEKNWLQQADKPVLLRLGRSRRGKKTEYWVLFLGDQNGRARIYDAPRPIEEIDYADLLAAWDGVGILVSDVKKTSLTNWLQSRLFLLTWVVLPFGIALLIKIFGPNGMGNPNRNVGYLFGQACLLAVISVCSATAFHLFAPVGFASNNRAIRTVARPFKAGIDFPVVEFEEVQQNRKDCVLIDSRPPASYLRGHIPGAVSLPVDASIAEYAEVVKSIPKEKTIILYCSKPACQWSKIVAEDLRIDGYKNIKIYEAGLREWRSRQKSK